MVDNVKLTKVSTTSYVKGKPGATSNSNPPSRSTHAAADGVLSERLERVIKSLREDTELDDSARVNALKAQVSQGIYKVDANKLASDLIQEYPPVLANSDQ